MSEESSETKDVLAKLQPWLKQHTRPAWKPLVQNREISLVGSKFCGTPALARGEAWPRCAVCQSEMPLFLQLNSQDLPAGFAQPFGGILQFFYCVSADCDCESYLPFEPNKLLRIIHPTGELQPPKVPGAIAGEFPCKSITGW